MPQAAGATRVQFTPEQKQFGLCPTYISNNVLNQVSNQDPLSLLLNEVPHGSGQLLFHHDSAFVSLQKQAFIPCSHTFTWRLEFGSPGLEWARAPFVLRTSALLEASSAHKEDSAQETKPNHSSRSILFCVTVSSVWPQETESRLKNPKVWTQYTTTQRHRQEPGLVWRQKAGEN